MKLMSSNRRSSCSDFVYWLVRGDPMVSSDGRTASAPYTRKNGGVCTLGLTIDLGVRWRCIADLGAHLLTELEKGCARELRAIIGDDAVGDAESYEDAANELHRCCCGNLPDWLCFRPLGELI